MIENYRTCSRILPQKDTEMKRQLKPGHYPMIQKARPKPLRSQEEVGKELVQLMRTGHLEIVKHLHGDCFVSPVVIKVESVKSKKIALDSRKLKDSCIKIRPHMPHMEGLVIKFGQKSQGNEQ